MSNHNLHLRFNLSNTALEELARMGIHNADIANLIRSKTELKMNERGLSVKVPLKEPFDVFLSNFKQRNYQGRRMSPLTYDTYNQVLRDFYCFCIDCQKKQGQDVGILDTSALGGLAKKFLATVAEIKMPQVSTYRKYVSIIRSFMHSTCDYYGMDPMTFPKVSSEFRRLPLALPDGEVRNLLQISRESRYGVRSHFMVSMFLGLGLRRAEFLNMRVEHIHLREGWAYVVGKGSKQRNVVIPEPLIQVIEGYLDKYKLVAADYVYPSLYNKEKQASAKAIDKHAMYLLSKLKTYTKGDPIHQYHLHSLRHTYATELLCNGVDLTVIQSALGHSSVTTTQVYTVLDVNRLREQLRPGIDVMRSWWDV